MNTGLITVQKYYSMLVEKFTVKIIWFIFVYFIEFQYMEQLSVYPTARKFVLVFVIMVYTLKDKNNFKICKRKREEKNTLL